MAHCGEAGETRTLHPLALPALVTDPGDAERRRGLYVDCETTGFSPGHDAVIELAMLPFTYTFEGSVVEVLHDEAQVHRNDPGRPLPAEITHLTGLTDDDVRGERIDVEPDEEEAEFAWLRETVYGGMWHYLPPGGIPRRRVDAFERWREDPADLEEQVRVYPGASAPVAM